MSLKSGKYLNKINLEIENISPLNIGGDDGEPIIDSENNMVYIPGTTIAGAMKNYLSVNHFKNLCKFFGDQNENFQSKLYVYDTYSNLQGKEVRPGVSINSITGTAYDKGKFERVYVGPGHKFFISFEIFANNIDEFNEFNNGIYACISAINEGKITFGSHKTSGAGIFKVNTINETKYNFSIKEDLFMYLMNSKQFKTISVESLEKDNIYNNSFVEYELIGEIETPLLIKGVSTLDPDRADGEQYQNNKGEYIIPGSSLKGVVRSQGERILNFYNKGQQISEIFGSCRNEEKKKASRFTAFDTVIKENSKTSYNKIKVDRFTAGIITGQKMEDEPIMGQVTLKGSLRLNDGIGKDEAVGLIALIYRDMAIGELPLGSGNNIGRGRIKGKTLKIIYSNKMLFNWDISKKKAETNEIDDYISALSKKEAI